MLSAFPFAQATADNLDLTGSTALANLMSLWASAFHEQRPDITLTIADPGGSVGLKALLNGNADLVLAAQPLPENIEQDFLLQYHYPLRSVAVAMDAVAVYVNHGNPIRRISIKQIDAVFSNTLRCGEKKPISYWKELGIAGHLGNRAITSLGLDVDSGAHALFRQIALCGGDFRPDFQSVAGPDEVQAGLENDVSSIGFASSSLQAPNLRALAISLNDGSPAIAPTPASIQHLSYPMARKLVVVYNHPPQSTLPPSMQDFLDFVRSPAGQEIAHRAGYTPLPARPPSAQPE